MLRFASLTLLMSASSILAAAANDTPTQVPSLTLTILDESGAAIPQAKFSYSGDPKPHNDAERNKNAETDENGRFVFDLNPEKPQNSLRILIQTPGYTFFLTDWGSRYSGSVENDPIPAEFSVKLAKGAAVGGRVLDDTGKPLADVSVEFILPWGKRTRIKQPEHHVHACRTKTDNNGLWKYESIPLDLLDSDVWVTFKHPEYKETVTQFKLAGMTASAEGTFAPSVQMEQGITLKGRVTDTAGKPVAGAVVVGRNANSDSGDTTRTTTNENGEYAFKNWTESRSAYIGVWKAGMMAALKTLSIQKENPPVDFTLKPAGKPVTIKVVNKAGEPIKGFYIAIERWGDHRLVDAALLTGKDRPHTDENGRWTWNEAPEEAVVFDMFLNDNHMDVRKKSIVPRDEEYVFVSEDPLSISGSVADAATGAAIPNFEVYFAQNVSETRTYWEIKRGAGAKGTYRVGTTYPTDGEAAVKIEAEGYEPAISRNIAYNEGNITLDFALKKLSPEKAAGIHGIVLLPDGKPAADVSVAMATHGESRPYIQNGRLERSNEDSYTVSTNKEGRFQFKHIDFEKEAQQRFLPPGMPKVDFILLFLHDSGFKRLTQQDWESLDENKTVTLESWGRIEGTVKIGTQPGKKLPVQCDVSFSNERTRFVELPVYAPYVFMSYNTIADESGKFSLERVPPGFVIVGRTIKFNDTGQGHSSTGSHSSERFELKPGATAAVALGGVGRPVAGKLVPVKEFETPPDWTFAHVVCTPAEEKIELPIAEIEALQKKMVPKEILENRDDPAKAMEWLETDDGKKFNAAREELTKDFREAQERNAAKRLMQRVCAVAQDGTFRLDDVPEGDWQLAVQLDAPPPSGDVCGTGGQIGRLEYAFSVAAIPGGVSDEPFDLGTLAVQHLAQQNPMPKAGDLAPEFEVVKIDPIAASGKFEDKGAKLRLSDYKGKYVILDFWATWCGPCLAKVPELKTLYDKIKDDERFVMIGISLDNAGSEEMLGKFVTRREMTWLHGLSGDWNSDTARTYGIHAIPALLLIGLDGKVLLSNPGAAELTKKIDELRK